jgi:hypothetical protein
VGEQVEEFLNWVLGGLIDGASLLASRGGRPGCEV